MNQQNNAMDAKILAAIIIPVATVIFSSNSFSTEILTDFDVEKRYAENSEKTSSLILKNIGLIQAKDVVAHIQFDSEITIAGTDCQEGNISYNKDTISVVFERMSTNVYCIIDFPKSSNYNTTDILITSENRSAVYPELEYVKDFWTHILTMFAFTFALELIIIFYISKIIYDGLLQVSSWHHKNLKCWKKIKIEIKNTHNVKTDNYDASIICSIIHGNSTIAQINADTKIRKTYVKRRVSFLQKNDILLPDRIRVHDSIEKSIRGICN